MTNYYPAIRIHNWDVTEVSSPAGRRNIAGGFGFKKSISFGCEHETAGLGSTTSGTLDFNGPKFIIDSDDPPSHAVSPVEALTFHLIASGTAISDLRLYLIDDSALTRPSLDRGIEPAFIQMETSTTWTVNKTMASGVGIKLTAVVPSSGTIYRQDGFHTLYDQNDSNSSEFIYLNIVAPWGFPFGQFGICGSGLLRLGFVYTYWPDEDILIFGEPGF